MKINLLFEVGRPPLTANSSRAVHIHSLVLKQLWVGVNVFRPVTKLSNVRTQGTLERSLQERVGFNNIESKTFRGFVQSCFRRSFCNR